MSKDHSRTLPGRALLFIVSSALTFELRLTFKDLASFWSLGGKSVWTARTIRTSKTLQIEGAIDGREKERGGRFS